MRPIEAALFRRRLAEVIAWCAPYVSIVDPAGCLRTSTLRPPDLSRASRTLTKQLSERLAKRVALAPDESVAELVERQAQEFSSLYQVEAPAIQAERQAIVDALSDERARLLEIANTYPDPRETDLLASSLAGGRLLICAGLDESVIDGAAEAESRGFFDVNDLAPWDTWICYVPQQHGADGAIDQASFVMSWVPSVFLDLVEAGIRVNPVGCILWAEEDDSPYTRYLRMEGVI